MSQVRHGPVNITYPDQAEFVAEFYDAFGGLSIPGGATVSITYTNLNFASQTDTLVMSPVGSFFTAVWSSINAIPGLAPWTVTATGMSGPAQQGIIRVIED